jgi:hypothetical protein
MNEWYQAGFERGRNWGMRHSARRERARLRALWEKDVDLFWEEFFKENRNLPEDDDFCAGVLEGMCDTIVSEIFRNTP